jgi:hypothetical protein
MRVCFLVLTHYNPDVFARLARELASDGDPVVAHVDVKVDQRPFEVLAPASDLLHYERDRVDVKWGSSSIMAAQLKIMRTALRVAPTADYYWLVSGDSYPTQSVRDIKAFLAAQHPAEYLNYVPMPHDEYDKPLYRLSHYRLDFDGRVNRFRLFYMALNRLARRPYKHHFKDMPPYGGSNWFTLTREATRYIVDYLDTHPRFWRYALTTGATEEWLPHTLLANEPSFRPRLGGALFWADFRPTTPPPRPPAIGEEQVDHLKQLLVSPESGFPLPGPPFMVRKFGTDSDHLAARVRAELWPIAVTPNRPSAHTDDGQAGPDR